MRLMRLVDHRMGKASRAPEILCFSGVSFRVQASVCLACRVLAIESGKQLMVASY